MAGGRFLVRPLRDHARDPREQVPGRRGTRRTVAGATANGLVVGAYHFAKPSLGLRDARGEADHFLRVARVAPGDVLPVLDIEETGGLSPAAPGLGAGVAASCPFADGRPRDDLLRQLLLARVHAEHLVVRAPWASVVGRALGCRRPRRPRRPLGGQRLHGLAVVGQREHPRHQGSRRPRLDERGSDARDDRLAHRRAHPTGARSAATASPAVDNGTAASRLANPGDEITLRAKPDEGRPVDPLDRSVRAGG